MPALSFVTAARIPPEGDPVGIWTIAPDLAVEIVSPNSTLWLSLPRQRHLPAAYSGKLIDSVACAT
jgi:Uma2 family endonuclease